ncbi:hypothetical protein H4R33_006120 [Dimargaris cristalligena]|nr:hypothetical protein H4R33_006120 [Dimargaris cristalligena]
MTSFTVVLSIFVFASTSAASFLHHQPSGWAALATPRSPEFDRSNFASSDFDDTDLYHYLDDPLAGDASPALFPDLEGSSGMFPNLHVDNSADRSHQWDRNGHEIPDHRQTTVELSESPEHRSSTSYYSSMGSTPQNDAFIEIAEELRQASIDLIKVVNSKLDNPVEAVNDKQDVLVGEIYKLGDMISKLPFIFGSQHQCVDASFVDLDIFAAYARSMGPERFPTNGLANVLPLLQLLKKMTNTPLQRYMLVLLDQSQSTGGMTAQVFTDDQGHQCKELIAALKRASGQVELLMVPLFAELSVVRDTVSQRCKTLSTENPQFSCMWINTVR